MNIIVKPTSLNLDDYLQIGINSFLLPLKDYSVEYTNYYSLNQIKKIKTQYPKSNIFVSINKNLFNRDIEEIKLVLQELDNIDIKGIFYYDLAILNIKKELNLKTDLVWSQTHMITNYETCDYYHSLGVEYALLSKEITKEEILKICSKSKIRPIIELISYPTVAFSKRKLITNYEQNYNLKNNDKLQIIESKTKQQFTLVEDQNGVSFIASKLVNGSRLLKDLVKYDNCNILLKEDLINHDIFLECLNNVKYYVENYKNLSITDEQKWLEKQNKLLGRNTGFLYRKTIYQVK